MGVLWLTVKFWQDRFLQAFILKTCKMQVSSPLFSFQCPTAIEDTVLTVLPGGHGLWVRTPTLHEDAVNHSYRSKWKRSWEVKGTQNPWPPAQSNAQCTFGEPSRWVKTPTHSSSGNSFAASLPIYDRILEESIVLCSGCNKIYHYESVINFFSKFSFANSPSYSAVYSTNSLLFICL